MTEAEHHTMRPTRDHVRKLLKGAGLRATTSRITILEILLRDETHPLIDEVHRSVRRKLPGISLSTVYETVERLVQAGLCRRIESPGEPARVDASPGGHLHARCQRCGRIVDLPADRFPPPKLPARRIAGFELQSIQVTYGGFCWDCRAPQRDSTPRDRPSIGGVRRRKVLRARSGR